MGIALIAGCSEGEKGNEADPVGREYAIKALEGIIESGQGGSEIGLVVEELQKLKETEPELAEKLIEESNNLMSAENSDQLKERAQAMLDQLTGGGGATEGEAEKPAE